MKHGLTQGYLLGASLLLAIVMTASFAHVYPVPPPFVAPADSAPGPQTPLPLLGPGLAPTPSADTAKIVAPATATADAPSEGEVSAAVGEEEGVFDPRTYSSRGGAPRADAREGTEPVAEMQPPKRPGSARRPVDALAAGRLEMGRAWLCLTSTSSPDKGAEIGAVAARYADFPYYWGGHSPTTGFDCSGFTWYVYDQAGIAIPKHDLGGQLNAGQMVTQSDLQPGDLVFFQNTYKPGLSHSGVYVGGGTFIHAVDERIGVTYSRLDDSYWRTRFLAGSRPR